ncbi:hypothetical protein GOARA_062_00160 [Gordonia araii NBRC 100433]|uniref:Uncharacterized protein n=1 Tax=Gordonia araii NBRC 100433 TaxID=1073574 RepID=G7H4H3_9ACTN|nr:hypothetical protein [Gordonia araii]NNG96195.1 hypothetical protein [Gordonia araii NBRC 100433]GAB10748.1 hypothetical protein GOARA_062_00160 [Gordonia araii NBRC 100433]
MSNGGVHNDGLATAERNGALTRFSAAISRALAPRAERAIELPDPQIDLRLTSVEPGATTGLAAHFVFPTAPNGRPYSIREIGVEFPDGFDVDFTAVPTCRPSRARMFFSRAAYRAPSLVGSGTARVDFGVPGLEEIGSPLHEIVLGDGCFFSYEHNRVGIGGRTVTVFPLVFRTPLDSSGFLWEIGEAPSFRRPDGLDALISASVEFDDKGVFRLPPTPPSSGVWEFTFRFRYYNESRSRVVVAVPAEGLR